MSIDVLTSERTETMQKLQQFMDPDASGIVLDFMDLQKDPFGAKKWSECLGVDIGQVPELSKKFYDFWNGPDPIDPSKQVWQTHFFPVFRPRWVSDSASRLRSYNLATLRELAQRQGTQIYGNTENQKDCGPGYWIVMRKDVVARNQFPLHQTRSMRELKMGDYEEMPSVLDVATVILAHYALTKERYLADNTGMEGRRTYSRCKNDKDYVVVGNFESGGFRVGMNVDMDESIGVSCLHKF